MTTADTATIEIPRLPDETPRAYAARVEYLTMGAGRSIDKLLERLQSGHKADITKRRSTIGEWSARYAWQHHAAQYDQTLANLATRRAAQRYLDDLEEHRERYQRSGKALHGVAVAMLTRLSQSSASIEYTPAALSTIARALTTAADLEAHALRVADLLPRLTDDQPDS